MNQREESQNPDEFSDEYKQGFKDGWDAIEERIKNAIRSYEAQIFICDDCDKLAYMVDPGDGLVSHIK